MAETTQSAVADIDDPLESSGAGTADSTAAATTAATAGTEEQEGTQLPPDLAEAFKFERLKLIPGETTEQAYARMTDHLRRKSSAHYERFKALKSVEEQHRAEMADLRSRLDPILRAHYKREHREALEAQAAQIPDKETDPEGYKIWLSEQILLENERRKIDEAERAERARREAADADIQQQFAAIDESGYNKVAEGLGLFQGVDPDPDFVHAYEIFSESAIAGARAYFPDADDAKIEEFVGLSQQLDIRRAEMAGEDYRDVLKIRFNGMIDSLVRRGLVTRAAKGQQLAAETSSGKATPTNGQVKASAAGVAATVAQKVAAESRAASQRSASAVQSTTRPSTLPGQLPDAGAFDNDEDYVEAALAGLLGPDTQRSAPHRKER